MKFDRLVSYDAKSRDYPIRELISTTTLRSFTWSNRVVLDQGNEGACVGFGWSGELAARPVVVPNIDNASAHALYKIAQGLDEWPGDNYEGTSVIAGAKAVKQLGYVTEYRWAFTTNDVLLALGYHGPVVFGFNWREGMMHPDDEGYIHATGSVVGGHCILGRAVNVRHKGILLQNSWGMEWGMNGCAHLSWDDLSMLLKDQGECCIPVHRSLGASSVPPASSSA